MEERERDREREGDRHTENPFLQTLLFKKVMCILQGAFKGLLMHTVRYPNPVFRIWESTHRSLNLFSGN